MPSPCVILTDDDGDCGISAPQTGRRRASHIIGNDHSDSACSLNNICFDVECADTAIDQRDMSVHGQGVGR